MDYVRFYPVYTDMSLLPPSIFIILHASNPYSRGSGYKQPMTDHHRLQVDVAERTRNGTHEIPHSNSLTTSITNINERVKSSVRRRGAIQESTSARNSIQTLVEVQVLPDPPGAINHTMVEPESRVTRTNKYITRRITAHRVVTTTVDTDTAASGNTLHVHLEVVDIVVAQNQVHDRGEVSVILDDLGAQIALQAAGVVCEWVGLASGFTSGKHQRDRAHVDRVVLERTAGDAAASAAGGQVNYRVVGQAQLNVTDGFSVGSVTGHRSVAAVEDLGFFQVGGVSAPVPVTRVKLELRFFFRYAKDRQTYG